jgi:hypothetical protein
LTLEVKSFVYSWRHADIITAAWAVDLEIVIKNKQARKQAKSWIPKNWISKNWISKNYWAFSAISWAFSAI